MSTTVTKEALQRDWELNGSYELGEPVSVVSDPEGGRVESFKDLWVWKHGMELVKEVYLLTRKLPKEEQYGLTSQLRRATVSVPSNIAEGWGRNKTGYLLLGMSYARGSLHEIETQLLICVDLEMLNSAETKPLLDHIGAVSVGLLRFMNKLDVKKR